MWYLNLGLIRKLVFGYIVFIILPMAGTWIFFNSLLYDNSIKAFDLIQKNTLEQVKGNLNVEVSQIEYIYNLLQYNRDMIDIMTGYYQKETEQQQVYQKGLNDLFEYAKGSNENISDLIVYRSSPQIFTLEEDIIGMEWGILEIYNSIRDKQGIWRISSYGSKNSLLKYYRKLYDIDFTQEIGMIEIAIQCEKLFSVLQPAENDGTNAYVYALDNGKLLMKHETFSLSDEFFEPLYEIHLQAYENGEDEDNVIGGSRNGSLLVNGFVNENLGIYIMTVTDVELATGIENQTEMVVIILLPLIATLTLIYFFTFSTFIRLVYRFTRHIKASENDNLEVFKGKVYDDEIGLLIGSYNQMVTRINELLINVHKAQIQQKDAEFQALQSQINPHFIYNTLETIRMIAQMGESEKAADMAEDLGKLMRYSLSQKDSHTTLQDEIGYVRNYLNIHKIRMGERLEYTFDVKIDISDVYCPKFILQPLVENCILHGIGMLRRKGVIKIVIDDYDEYIRITISDNGVGIPDDVLKNLNEKLADRTDIMQDGQSGIGITNVNARINSYYGEDSGIRIESELDKGTTYIVILRMKGGLMSEINDNGR